MNRINLICLGVRDMARSLAFYKEIGFKTYEKHGSPPIVFFDNAGTKLELFSIEGLVKDIDGENPPQISAGGFPGMTLAINVKSEKEVEDFIKIVEDSDGTIVKSPEPTSWGGYHGYFQDPDGYYWEVAYGAMWKFDERDMLVIEDTN